MRERIIAILQKYEEQPFSRPSECADEIIALFKIAEMPTEEERKDIKSGIIDNLHKFWEKENHTLGEEAAINMTIRVMSEWFRNRTTSSEKPNNHTRGEERLWRDIQEKEREGFCSPAHSSPKNVDSSKIPENI